VSILSRIRGDQRDDGFSLVEMFVVIGLMATVTAMVSTAVITGLRSQRRVDGRSTSLDQVRAAMQRVTREIRDEDTVLLAQSSTLEFQQTNASRIRCYTVTTSGGTSSLVVYTTSLTYATPCVAGASNKATTVLPSLANSSAQPVFAYTPKIGFTPSSNTVSATTCAITGTSPTTYAPDCPATVTLRFVQTIANAPAGIYSDFSDTVELRNQS
jgi:hypothetical protein